MLVTFVVVEVKFCDAVVVAGVRDCVLVTFVAVEVAGVRECVLVMLGDEDCDVDVSEVSVEVGEA